MNKNNKSVIYQKSYTSAAIQLLRPQQWLKNIFIFLPLFFGERLFDISALIPALYTFILFSLTASSIYCFNDIQDIDTDKLHPEKCNRPISSGRLSIKSAYIIAFLLILSAIGLCCIIFTGDKLIKIGGVLITYYLVNIFYCLKLKQIAILDVFIIACGFVIRVLAGGISTDIWISHWIILMTFLLTLFLAFAKRRDDVILLMNTGKSMRKNTNRYNLSFLNQALSIIASVTLVSYIMYTVSEEVTGRMQTSHLYITTIWVIAGVLRYLQLAIVDEKTGNPTQLLIKDHFIQFCILGWLLTFSVIIYF